MLFVFVGVLTILLAIEAKNGVQDYSNSRSVTSSVILFETPNTPVIAQQHQHTKNYAQTIQNSEESTSCKTCNKSLLGNSDSLKNHPLNLQPDSFVGFEPSALSIRRRGNRGNLDMKMNDEWTKNGIVNHIYIGSSLFPLITEESRVIDKKQTLFSFPTTKKSVTQQKTPHGGGYRSEPPLKEQQIDGGRLSRSLDNLQNIMKMEQKNQRVEKKSRQDYTEGKLEENKIVYALRRHEFIPDWLQFWRSL